MLNDELIIGSEGLGNVLIVDDNSKNLQIISMALSQYGYKVAVANSANNALKYLERKSPDLILLDIMMPETDGYDLCRIIKKNPDINHIPIIFLTAKNETDDLVKGFRLGAVDYLVKPYNNEELIVRVNTHIQLKKSKELIVEKSKELDKLNNILIETQNRIIRDAQDLTALNESLTEKEQKLSELIDSKNKFFTIVAHDLKGPFSGLVGLSDILAKDINSLSNDEVAEFSQMIYDTALVVYELLDELLQWSLSQIGDMNFEPSIINLRETSDKAINKFVVVAALKGIKVINNISSDIIVKADSNMISAIFRNLLGNSIKFTETNGKIEFSSEINDNKVIINISDTGIGMSQEKADKLFKLHNRESSIGTAGEKGSGLGLELVKEFVLAHGGSVEAKSKISSGTVVSFTLPLT